MSIATFLFTIFIYQKTKSTTVLYIYGILEECPKSFLEIFLFDVDRLKLPKRSQDVIFGHIFKMIFYIVVFSILATDKHVDIGGKHTERIIKDSFYNCVTFVESRPKDV